MTTQNTTTNTTPAPAFMTKEHPFQKAGLGLAPFRFVRCYEAKYQACHGAPVQPGSTCDYCGTAIMYVFVVRGACGTEFKVGCDCVEKTDAGHLVSAVKVAAKRMKAEAKEAREFETGKAKACAILTDAGLLAAWELWNAEYSEAFKYEENTVRDIVGKLVKWGNVSEKSLNYVRVLLGKLAERPAIEAKKAAEVAAAASCPVGRVEIIGEVVSIKEHQGAFGYTLKMLVKHATGFKVWGTIPSNLTIEKGAVVMFTATVEPSKDDRTFGFFTRPAKACVITPAVPNA